MRIAALGVCLAMSGCASLPSLPFTFQRSGAVASYVAPEIRPYEAEIVARDMAVFISSQFPAAKTTIELEPSRALLHQFLVTRLRMKGFGVVGTDVDSDHAVVPVRYFVTHLDGGVLVRLRYQHKMAGRYYTRTEAGTLFSNVYAVREAIQ